MKKTQLTVGGTPTAGADVNSQLPPSPASSSPPDDPSRSLEERVRDAIREVYDPEIPVNIYELGLIYDIRIDQATGDVKVIMTLTSPACPAAQSLPLEVRRNVARLQGVSEVDVEIVFEPPWSPEKMSEAAKLTLGML